MSATGTRHVLVCVTGGIAAYKACEVVRLLQKRGLLVKVLMSEHATHFVDPLTFRSLTHAPVAVGLFDDPADPIHHISLAQEADAVVIVPATANIIAKLACGIADDLLSTTLLATRAPILVAPAMNTAMWEAPATQHNLAALRARGVRIIEPAQGRLACGDVGAGKLAAVEDIARAVEQALTGALDRAGERIVITAGPTHEPIDPVRYIGNNSSGKMGIALARAAVRRGAQVDLVLGPVSIDPPVGATVHRVTTAAEMYAATARAFEDATVLVCAAAVADYAPKARAARKLKKENGPLESIELEQTVDILATLSAHKEGRVVIGFAAETGDPVAYGTAKLARKGCDAIVANDVSRPDSTFGSDTDKAWIISRAGTEELPALSKAELADRVLTFAHSLRTSA